MTHLAWFVSLQARACEGRLAELHTQLTRSQQQMKARDEEVLMLKMEMASLRDSYTTKVAQVSHSLLTSCLLFCCVHLSLPLLTDGLSQSEVQRSCVWGRCSAAVFRRRTEWQLSTSQGKWASRDQCEPVGEGAKVRTLSSAFNKNDLFDK